MSLHEPAVASDQRLTGERIGVEHRKQQGDLCHILHRGELPVYRLFQHPLLNHIVFAVT
jgi:hypothetical protein